MKQIKLSTEVGIAPQEWKISYESKILTMGSCFAEVLGNQLKSYKFQVLNNPFGTIFNPLTITRILDSALENKGPNPALFVKNPDDIWLHHDFHSSLWDQDRGDLQAKIEDKLEEVRSFLEQTDVLVITLGTAYAYRHKQTNTIVGNCHKIPGSAFMKELLHPDQICSSFELLIQKLLTFRRKMKVLLTVSPVRHTKDTLPLNQVSKATLRLACHRLSEKYRHVVYFPSYEIMIDELRDYRFYEEDLIHPNRLAGDYIFQVFSNAFVENEAHDLMKEWENVRQTIDHRPHHGQTSSYLKLLQTTLGKLYKLHPSLDVSTEIRNLESRIQEFQQL